MSSISSASPIGFRVKREPKIPSPILGMSIFVVTELMFFTALISAFLVIRASSSNWAPPADVILPVWTTSFNTAVLMTSGILLLVAGRYLKKDIRSDFGLTLTLWSIALGIFFVAYQGYEWVSLIRYGMTLKSDIYGSCFYLIIGSHGLHALAAIAGMVWMYRKLAAGKLRFDAFRAMQIFWIFVVGIWPVLYALVYFPS